MNNDNLNICNHQVQNDYKMVVILYIIKQYREFEISINNLKKLVKKLQCNVSEQDEKYLIDI